MTKSGRNLILGLAMLLVALPLAASKTGDEYKKTSDENKRKAEYIFIEAQSQKTAGNFDAFYDLTKYAHQLDPSNTAISFYLGYCMISMHNTTDSVCNKGLRLMKSHCVEFPSNLYESTFYSDACMALGKNGEALRTMQALSKYNPTKPEIQIRLAEAYSRVGNFRKSIETYDSIEKLQGKSIMVTSKKLSAFAALKDTAGAINEMHKMLATAPKNAVYNITMSNVMQQFGRNDSALYYLDKAQEYEPDNGGVYYAKAQYYNMIGDSANYDKQIYQALINKNLDIDSKLDVLTGYIKQLLQQRDSSNRIDNLFKVLVEQNPHESTIHSLYSDYLTVKKDYKGAAEQLGYELDIDPTNAQGWRKLMVVNMMAENFPAAVEAAQKAMSFNPDSLDLLQYIAPAYYQMKQYDKALATYDTALAKIDTATNVELYSDLVGGKGDVYYSMGDTAKAFSSYKRALEINPSNVGIMNNYAYFLSECNLDLDKAERMSAMAVKAQPDNATFLDTYAWIYYKKKEYKLALMYIKSAIEKDDTHSADVYEHYGDILFMSGQPDQAVEQWKKALEKSPSSTELQNKIKNKSIEQK
jgi:tetratricopeptide (TPR) repeat protein